MDTKIADLSFTKTMPAQPSADTTVDSTKAVIKKTGSSHLLPGHKASDVEPDVAHPPMGEQPGKHPQMKVMNPHIDVSGLEPKARITEKRASVTALHGKYPLDNLAQIKMASQYFNDYWKMFTPADRHEFAKNLVKQASKIGIGVPDAAREYGSEKYASNERIQVCMDARRSLLVQDDEAGFRALLDKVAAQKEELPPEVFAEVVHEFDKIAHLDMHYGGDVPDPWTMVFAMEKEAEYTEVIGNMQVTESDLRFLASLRISAVKGVFTEEMAEEFQKDPVGIYKSLPVDQRKILGNLARSQSTTGSIS